MFCRVFGGTKFLQASTRPICLLRCYSSSLCPFNTEEIEIKNKNKKNKLLADYFFLPFQRPLISTLLGMRFMLARVYPVQAQPLRDSASYTVVVESSLVRGSWHV